MKVKAYAKINLGLHIVGKRQDGFHNIETVFHRINLFDEINIENSGDISISCSDPSIPTDSNNLCWKTVELLRNELRTTNGAAIEIKKNIPAGAQLFFDIGVSLANKGKFKLLKSYKQAK